MFWYSLHCSAFLVKLIGISCIVQLAPMLCLVLFHLSLTSLPDQVFKYRIYMKYQVLNLHQNNDTLQFALTLGPTDLVYSWDSATVQYPYCLETSALAMHSNNSYQHDFLISIHLVQEENAVSNRDGRSKAM